MIWFMTCVFMSNHVVVRDVPLDHRSIEFGILGVIHGEHEDILFCEYLGKQYGTEERLSHLLVPTTADALCGSYRHVWRHLRLGLGCKVEVVVYV